MNEIITAFAAVVGPALAKLLAALLSLALIQTSLWLRRKSQSEWAAYAAGVLERTNMVARDALGDAGLEFRDEWDKVIADGKVTPDEMKLLLNKGRDITLDNLGSRGLKDLATVVDKGRVEAVVMSMVRTWLERRMTGAKVILPAEFTVVEESK